MLGHRPSARGISTLGLIAALCLVSPALSQICENSNPALGSAQSCAVLQMGGGKLEASHGDPTGVFGNACVGPDGELSMSGGQIISGTAFLDPNYDKIPNDLADRAGDIVVGSLSSEISAATQASAAASALSCDLTLDELKIKESAVWSVSDVTTGSQAVVCVEGNMEVAGSGTKLLLTGDAGDSFVFRIDGALKVNGAKVETFGDLTPSSVLFHLEGSGSSVAFSGGGGGLGCCKAELEGTILALDRKVALSPGRVTGQVISYRDIKLSSGSIVDCIPSRGGRPDPPDVPN